MHAKTNFSSIEEVSFATSAMRRASSETWLVPLMAEPRAESFLDAFHRGDRAALEACYREHFDAVLSAIRLASLADRETVAHDLFCRLVGNADFRGGFRGGNMRAWLRTAATHAAIDYARKYKREVLTDDAASAVTLGNAAHDVENDAGAQRDAERIVAHFVADKLPPAWRSVFEVRFRRGLGQHETARELGIARTTVMYQEHRIRGLRSTPRASQPRRTTTRPRWRCKARSPTATRRATRRKSWA